MAPVNRQPLRFNQSGQACKIHQRPRQPTIDVADCALTPRLRRGFGWY